jgi:hypothetical protein
MYVIEAVIKGNSEYQKYLYDIERPIALQTSIITNQNRDPKKGKMSTPEEFSYYISRELRDLPSRSYGSAAMTLIKQRRMPPWALFCYKDLSAAADPSYVPPEPALIACDAMLLHPVRQGSGYMGMLIAMESASEQERVFKNSNDEEIRLIVPFVRTKFIAEEDVTLPIP